jgi:plasmid stabilization system protein ParE
VPRRVKLLPRAQNELETFPLAIQDQIIAKIELLRDFPEMGPAMFDAFQGYRALLAARNTYRIVYRIISDDLIEIAYIRHCSRQTRLRIIRGKG